jgi:hypothetical protein
MTNGLCITCIDGYIIQKGDCIKKIADPQSQQQTNTTQNGGAVLISNTSTVTQNASTS